VSVRDRALAEACARYAEERPATAALHERAKAAMPGGNTRTVLYHSPFPIRAAKAEGASITDADGHEYIDFVGEYSAGIYGHSNPRIREAVAQALEAGLNMGAHHAGEIPFAEAVCKRFNLDLVRFTNSGTEANMMALGAARSFTGREKIVAFHGGYHGGTLYFAHGASPVNAPFDVLLGHYNDIPDAKRTLDEGGAGIAAIILEPMQGGGGCIGADTGFLRMLRDESARRGIVLVFDEVMTSRLGPNGYSAAVGIEPDLKTLGKYIGGGMSFGAFGGKREIMAQFDPSRPDALPHAGTFNNNTLTMAAGLAGISEIFTADACRSLNARGDRLRDGLNDLFMRYQAPMRATGIGSLLTIHPAAADIRTPEDAAKCDTRLRRLLFLDLLEQGLYIAERGFIALSLEVTDAHCDRLIRGVESFITRRAEALNAS
jgi:glutamate-1-semialdehyde 2,1-aminomutase